MLLALACFPALAAAFSQWRHPGIASPDELAVLAWCQHAFEGQWPWPALGRGFPTCVATTAWSWLGPHNALWLQALPSLALGLEILLLAHWCASLGGPVAGLGSAALGSIAAFSQLRARTLLAFNYSPLALLLLLCWLPQARQQRGSSFAWGLLLGLGLLNYEAWALAIPLLAWAYWQQRKEHSAWALAGLAVAVGAVLATWPTPGEYLARRSSQGLVHGGLALQGPLQALGTAFAGIPGSLELGPWPLLPWAGLPFFLLGLRWAWKGQRSLLPWCALGLLPLGLGDGAEARRAIIAWPAMAALCGLGLASLRPAWRKRALWLLPLAALGEAAALDRALSERDQACYALSRRHAAVAAELARLQPGPVRALTSLGGRDHGAERFLLPASTPGAPLWVLVPASYSAPQPDPSWGEWHELRVPGAAPAYWLKPKASDEARWIERDSQGLALARAPFLHGQAQGRDQARQAILSSTDAWQRTQGADALLEASSHLGGIAAEDLRLLSSQAWLSATPLLLTAGYLQAQDPAQALALARRATALDPRRGKAWLLRAQLAQALGFKAEAQEALQRAASADPDF